MCFTTASRQKKWEGNRLCFRGLFLILICYKWNPLWQHCTIQYGPFSSKITGSLTSYVRKRTEQLKYSTLKEITVGNILASFFLPCNLFMLSFLAIPKSWYSYVSTFMMEKVEYFTYGSYSYSRLLFVYSCQKNKEFTLSQRMNLLSLIKCLHSHWCYPNLK